MIVDIINSKIAEALKAHDEIRLSTLRLLSSAFNYEFIAKQHKLSDEEELAVVRREVKGRKDAIEGLKQAQSKNTTSTEADIKERLEREQKEMEILQEFLPAEMPEEELLKLVDEAIKTTGATTMADMGKVIGMVMGKSNGRADGGKVSQLVKAKLT
jgi:uncharacterized protein YqeY